MTVTGQPRIITLEEKIRLVEVTRGQIIHLMTITGQPHIIPTKEKGRLIIMETVEVIRGHTEVTIITGMRMAMTDRDGLTTESMSEPEERDIVQFVTFRPITARKWKDIC